MIQNRLTVRKQLAYMLLSGSATLASSSSFANNSDKQVRIVSTSGALTEIVYKLDAVERLVGVDTTSTYPQAASQLPQVGYQRALSAEGILSLNPGVVIATDEAGPPAVINQIKAAGIPVSIIPTDYSAEGIAAKIRKVAEAVNKKETGERMVTTLEAEMAALKALTDQTKHAPKRTIFVMNIGNGSPMVAGVNTAANALINIAGASNPVDAYEGYKPISIESLINLNPEAIIVTKRTLKSMGGIEGIMEIPGLAMTDAGKHQNIITLDGLSALGFTPRLPEAATALHKQIYPDAE